MRRLICTFVVRIWQKRVFYDVARFYLALQEKLQDFQLQCSSSPYPPLGMFCLPGLNLLRRLSVLEIHSHKSPPLHLVVHPNNQCSYLVDRKTCSRTFDGMFMPLTFMPYKAWHCPLDLFFHHTVYIWDLMKSCTLSACMWYVWKTRL